nr:CsgG/HfaB family protein [uncultured Rhodopila sp.]
MKFWAALALVALTSGCGTSASRVLAEAPYMGTRSAANDDLRSLPPPAQKLTVAVFAFLDQTGQHKPNENYADYSFAVTQGGASILINALKDAGQQSWFTVLERNRLGDLFQERQIIRANREEAAQRSGQPMNALGPLMNAGVIFEGGIIGYDANTLTGGVGANFLGIGGSTQYRKDDVAVYLRVISVLTGEVLVSLTTEKTIYSVGLDGSVNKYVGYNKLLQVEAGFTTNEPGQLAVKQAIELAVRSAILDGASRGYWHFADDAKGQPLIDHYVAERDGRILPAISASSPGGTKKVTDSVTGGHPS